MFRKPAKRTIRIAEIAGRSKGNEHSEGYILGAFLFSKRRECK